MASRQLNIKSALAWIWRGASGVKARVGLAFLCGIVRVGLALYAVWLSKVIVDAATTPGAETSRILGLAVAIASIMLVEMGLTLVVTYIENTTEARMKNVLRSRLYSHTLHSSRSMQQQRMHSGDLLNRLTEDVRVICDLVCQKLPDMSVMFFQIFAALVMLCFMSWRLALCALCIMPFFLLLSRVYVKRTRAITADVRASDSRIQSGMQEGIQHHVVVQTLECEDRMAAANDDEQHVLFGHVLRRTRVGLFSHGMIRMSFIACYLTAFLWSVWHLHTGAITFGTMTAFLQLMARVQNPMYGLSRYVPAFVNSISSADRLSEVEAFPAEDKSKSIVLSKPVGVRLKDVDFAYPGTDVKVLDGFSHDFAPGSKTVVMGETGVGKSTLIRLLLALLEPQAGSILLYDSSRQVPVSPATRCNMVYVPQGNSLLHGTVRENLLMGCPDATEQQMHEALHTACADFVLELPKGLDTHCGELGDALSEGQAQRIAIARALLRSGSVLLLDEFNSALDRHTAATLMHRLSDRYANCTVIYISHRREVMDYCDNVLELRQ